MEHDFDKRMRDLLDAAAPADTGFNLDKERVWGRIESGQKTKVIPFRKWLSHAAAVIIGMLLCLPFLFRKDQESIKTVTVTKVVPSIERITDTVLIVQHDEPVAYKQPTLLPATKKQPAESITAQALQPVSNNGTQEITETNPEPVIAAAVRSRPAMQVLHIADIENENAFPKARSRDGYTLFNKINFPSRMDDASETVSMIVSNQFSKSKN